MIDYDFATGNTNPESFPGDAFADGAARVIPTLTNELSRYPGKLGHEPMRRLTADREFDREGVRLSKRHDAGPDTLAAAITVEYLQSRLWQHIVTAHTALKAKRDAILSVLDRERGNLFSVSRPSGGLFIWLQRADEIDPTRLLEIANEDSVNFLPGSSFHIHGASNPFIRLAFGFPTITDIQTGIVRLTDSMRAARQTH